MIFFDKLFRLQTRPRDVSEAEELLKKNQDMGEAIKDKKYGVGVFK